MTDTEVGVANGSTGAALDEDIELGAAPAAVAASDVPLGNAHFLLRPKAVAAKDASDDAAL